MSKLDKIIEKEFRNSHIDSDASYEFADSLIEALIIELGKLHSNCGIKIFGGEARAFVLLAYSNLKGE